MQKLEHRAGLAVERGQLVVQRRAGSSQVLCAFSGIRNGSRRACIGSRRPGCEAARQQLGGAFAGGGHVDVRIGAVRHQRVGLAQHAPRDVGVQVEAGDDRQLRPDDRAQPRQQLAFAVVGVLGHRGAVQVEVDRVEPALSRAATTSSQIAPAMRSKASRVTYDDGIAPAQHDGTQRPAALPARRR